MAECTYANPFCFQEDDYYDPLYMATAEFQDRSYGYTEFCDLRTFVEGRLVPFYRKELAEAIRTGRVALNRSTKEVPQPTEAKLESFTLHRLEPVWDDDACKPGIFKLDVIVVAGVQISQLICDPVTFCVTNQQAHVTQWFRIRGRVDMLHRGNRLVESISIYRPKDRLPGRRLTDYLVPTFTVKDLDWAAKEVLIRGGMGHLFHSLGRINPKELAKALGLTVKPARLSRGYTVYAKLYLRGGQAPIVSIEDRDDWIEVAPGTILVDMEACGSQEMVNEAIIHECIHYVLHGLYLALQAEYYESLDYMGSLDPRVRRDSADDVYKLKLSESDLECPDKDCKPIEMVEWQARVLTSRILMPTKQFSMRADDIYYINLLESEDEMIACERAIRELARDYGVSLTAAKGRMLELGYEHAQGVANFVNGRYTRPFTTSNGHFVAGTTYNISQEELDRLYHTDRAFQDIMQNAPVRYVEGHICIFSPKYVMDNGTDYQLTDYARYHIEECCILFFRREVAQRIRYFRDSLHYDILNDNPYYISMAILPLEIMKMMNEKFMPLLNNLPATFGETLKRYRKDFNLTQADLAEMIGITREHLAAAEIAKKPKLTKEIIARIGHELRLAGIFTEDLLRKAGKQLDLTEPRDLMLHSAIYYCVDMDIAELNQQMIDSNCLPLMSKKDIDRITA